MPFFLRAPCRVICVLTNRTWCWQFAGIAGLRPCGRIIYWPHQPSQTTCTLKSAEKKMGWLCVGVLRKDDCGKIWKIRMTKSYRWWFLKAKILNVLLLCLLAVHLPYNIASEDLLASRHLMGNRVVFWEQRSFSLGTWWEIEWYCESWEQRSRVSGVRLPVDIARAGRAHPITPSYDILSIRFAPSLKICPKGR